MLSDILVTVLILGLPIAAWRAWLAFYPGISLRSDYGIRGGWFGSRVTIKGSASSLWRYVSS